MKQLNLLSFMALFVCMNLHGQFAETFFDQIRNKGDQYFYHTYGKAVDNGMLAVHVGDSAGKQVHWVKTNLQGDFQAYSSNMIFEVFSPKARIIDIFEEGNEQFMVSQDSAFNGNSEGITIHKFSNYVSSLSLVIPMELRRGYYQAYSRFGKFFIFVLDEARNFHRIKIDRDNFAVEENLVIGTNVIIKNSYIPTQTYKTFHVFFDTEDTQQVFFLDDLQSNLQRIQIVDGIAYAQESVAGNFMRVIGFDEQNKQVVCLMSNPLSVGKYAAEIDLEMNLSENNPLPAGITFQNLSSAYYGKYNAREQLLISYPENIILGKSSNTWVAQPLKQSLKLITNFQVVNGKLAITALRDIPDFVRDGSYTKNALFMGYGEIEEFTNYKEYGGSVYFGGEQIPLGHASHIFSKYTQEQNTSAINRFVFSSRTSNAGGPLKNSGMVPKPGPYTNAAQYNHEDVYKYNEWFYIDQYQVNNHVLAIQNYQPGYQIPKNIKNWPAHGDVSRGQAANLAPFVDVNNNQVYEPELGDYPSFPGTRCLLNISHRHTNDLNGKGSGFEIYNYLYSLECNDTVNDVFFLRHEIINRGNFAYNEMATAFYNDFDIGNSYDDRIGTHVELGMLYQYNGDNVDEDYQGITGLGDSIPSIGFMILRGNKLPSNSLDDQPGIAAGQTVNGYGFSDGVIDNEYKGMESSLNYSVSPYVESEQLFNLNSGKLIDGEPLTFSGIPYNFIYPGESDPLFYGSGGTAIPEWSEETTMDPPGERNGLSTVGSTSMQPGEKLVYHAAYIYGDGFPTVEEGKENLFTRAAVVKKYFNQNSTPCGQSFVDLEDITPILTVEDIKKENQKVVFPNPANESFSISGLAEGEYWMCHDVNGRVMVEKSFAKSQSIQEWKTGIYLVTVMGASGQKQVIKLFRN